MEFSKAIKFMNVKLTFSQNDFNSLKDFEKSVKRQLGNNIYVGTNSMCLYFDYPKELCAMLRPPQGNAYLDAEKLNELLTKEQLEFNLESSVPDEKRK